MDWMSYLRRFLAIFSFFSPSLNYTPNPLPQNKFGRLPSLEEDHVQGHTEASHESNFNQSSADEFALINQSLRTVTSNNSIIYASALRQCRNTEIIDIFNTSKQQARFH